MKNEIKLEKKICLNQNLQGFIVEHHDLLHGSCLFLHCQFFSWNKKTYLAKLLAVQSLFSYFYRIPPPPNPVEGMGLISML